MFGSADVLVGAPKGRRGFHRYNCVMQANSTITKITAECPCVGHCTTALGDDVCRSCLRTFEEVTRWPELNDDERININRRIAVMVSATS